MLVRNSRLCWFVSKTTPSFRTQPCLPKGIGDWTDVHGITWNYSTLVSSSPGFIDGDVQTTGYLSKYLRRYLRAEAVEATYADRRSPTTLDKYTFKLSAWLKTKATKSWKERRSLKQMSRNLCAFGFKGTYGLSYNLHQEAECGSIRGGNSKSKSAMTKLCLGSVQQHYKKTRSDG